MLEDATRRWRSSKATKQTRTRRCKTFKCCKMLLEDEADETRPRGCKYPTTPRRLLKYYQRRPCALSFVKSSTLRPLQKHFLLFQQIFFVLEYGLGPYSRPRAQFFPIRTSRSANNIYIFNKQDERK